MRISIHNRLADIEVYPLEDDPMGLYHWDISLHYVLWIPIVIFCVASLVKIFTPR